MCRCVTRHFQVQLGSLCWMQTGMPSQKHCRRGAREQTPMQRVQIQLGAWSHTLATPSSHGRKTSKRHQQLSGRVAVRHRSCRLPTAWIRHRARPNRTVQRGTSNGPLILDLATRTALTRVACTILQCRNRNPVYTITTIQQHTCASVRHFG